MTIENRIGNALRISKKIKNGKLSQDDLLSLNRSLTIALDEAEKLSIHNVRDMLIAKHERKIDELNKSHQNICEGGTNLKAGTEKWNNELILIEGKIAGLRLAINYL